MTCHACYGNFARYSIICFWTKLYFCLCHLFAQYLPSTPLVFPRLNEGILALDLSRYILDLVAHLRQVKCRSVENDDKWPHGF